MPFFRKIRGKRAFSMAKLSTEHESGNKNGLRWCFRSVNPEKSKRRPKISNFWYRPPLNDPPLLKIFNFFCFQCCRIPIYHCILYRCGYYKRRCTKFAVNNDYITETTTSYHMIKNESLDRVIGSGCLSTSHNADNVVTVYCKFRNSTFYKVVWQHR